MNKTPTGGTMKTEEIRKVWNEMTKEELVYLVNAQKVEMMVQAKKIETLEAKLVAVKAQRDDLIVDKLEKRRQEAQ